MCAPTSESKAQDLPQELLGEIFVRCLPKNVFDHLHPNSSLPPLVLCRVCRSWRKAALGTSHLWNELSMELEHVSNRSLGGGFLYSKSQALEFWASRMCALLPSLHFRRTHFRRFISHRDQSELVPFQTFFRSPAILNAQLLTLDGFFNLTTSVGDISFNNLEYLAITQPPGSEHHTLPRPFHTCLTLRRLHIDFHTWMTSPRSMIITRFSWVTLTHLNANFKMGRRVWSAILAQFTNMTSCSVVLVLLISVFPETNDRPPTLLHNLRTLNVQGTAATLSNIFDGFVFPSLVALRLSWTSSGATLSKVHQTITATPALKEFHLQFYEPFDPGYFLLEPQESQLAGPLIKFVPGLLILVFDRITPSPRHPSTTSDVIALLHSSWLSDDWVTLPRTQMSIEFIFDKGGPSLAEEFNGNIDRCGSLPFHASACYVPGGFWNWKQMTARELRDCWDDSLAFRHS